MKASRIGFTRCVMSLLGHFAANKPCSVALLLPSLDDARKTSIFEVSPLFEESPSESPSSFRIDKPLSSTQSSEIDARAANPRLTKKTVAPFFNPPNLSHRDV